MNCPRCNSEQQFVTKRRPTAQAWIECYVRCSVCRWETVLGYSTDEIEKLVVRFQELARRVSYEHERHGQASISTIKRRDQAGKQLRAARNRLEADMEAFHAR